MRNLDEVVEMSGRTPAEIAEGADIDLTRVVSILSGENPTMAELKKIARFLKIDLTTFVSKPSASPNILLFRDTMGKSFGRNQELTVEILSNHLDSTMELLNWGPQSTWLDQLPTAEVASYEEAERLAEKFRTEFFGDDQVSPILGLPQIVVERLDVVLMVTPKLPIDGASAFIDGNAFVFVAPRTFVARMLFTLAHELGHLVGHHRSLKNFAVFDSEETVGTSKASSKAMEQFADAFAACLLLPPAGVGIALKKVREVYEISGDFIGDIEILYLANLFGVSFQVAARRCEDLGLLKRGSAISLYEKVCVEFKNPEQRARLLGLPPRSEIKFPSVSPRLLSRAIEAVRMGTLSIGHAAKSLNIPIASVIHANRPARMGH